MQEDSAGNAERHYQAFISYSHADARFAGWLHQKLERQRRTDGTTLAPIFIDRAELAAGPDLSAQVRAALAQSAALVVVASPAARASRWVDLEIALYRELHPDRPILAALIEGAPAEAFPPGLLMQDGQTVEPLAADFRKGQDGQRLGMLKIAAGLTGQPLDRLVQRDATRRQRRVMAVTAGALLLSVILAAALIAAIRARADAERQRVEAEGLVEFMLTDLRDKLKSVGRLDVMDAVNQRAMTHYGDNSSFGDLSRQELLRRAKLLQAMAEDDLSSKERQLRGAQEAEAAHVITSGLYAKFPNEPAVILAHAKSEFWLGQVRYSDKSITAPERRAKAKLRWLEYRKLTSSLAGRKDAKSDWLVEASYAEGNLCAVELAEPKRPEIAIGHCNAATLALSKAWKLNPSDLDIGLNLAMAYAWQADAEAALRNWPGAIARRDDQTKLVDELTWRFPHDQRVTEARLLADFGMARLFADVGRKTEALSKLGGAEATARNLLAHDPGNEDWASWLKQISAFKVQLK